MIGVDIADSEPPQVSDEPLYSSDALMSMFKKYAVDTFEMMLPKKAFDGVFF